MVASFVLDAEYVEQDKEADDDGALVRATVGLDGVLVRPDDGIVVRPDDGVTVRPDDGAVERPDDGALVRPDDGASEGPDGAVVGATVLELRYANHCDLALLP